MPTFPVAVRSENSPVAFQGAVSSPRDPDFSRKIFEFARDGSKPHEHVPDQVPESEQPAVSGPFRESSGAASLAKWDVAQLRRRFLAAKPFPHLVLDGLIPADMLDAIDGEFDLLAENAKLHHDEMMQRKTGSRPNVDLPPVTQRYFDYIYSGPFLRFISSITGIDGLITDPSLHGGGMHEIPEGGWFQVHSDFQLHPRTGFRNRLVLITYLNRDWEESYGGSLELWRQSPPSCEVSILPEFGRTIIMLHSDLSTHGLPKPVAAPDGRGRRSVAAYYYTDGVEEGSEEAPPDGLFSVYTTRYLYYSRLPIGQKLALLVRQTVPPIVIRGVTAAHRGLLAWTKSRRAPAGKPLASAGMPKRDG